MNKISQQDHFMKKHVVLVIQVLYALAVMYKRGDGVEKDDQKFKMYAEMTKDLKKQLVKGLVQQFQKYKYQEYKYL